MQHPSLLRRNRRSDDGGDDPRWGPGTDRERSVDRELAAVLGQINFEPVGESFFLRLAFSAREMDETSRSLTLRSLSAAA
jgi:hypothetical protein